MAKNKNLEQDGKETKKAEDVNEWGFDWYFNISKTIATLPEWEFNISNKPNELEQWE